jgi:hypothetical protein
MLDSYLGGATLQLFRNRSFFNLSLLVLFKLLVLCQKVRYGASMRERTNQRNNSDTRQLVKLNIECCFTGFAVHGRRYGAAKEISA